MEEYSFKKFNHLRKRELKRMMKFDFFTYSKFISCFASASARLFCTEENKELDAYLREIAEHQYLTKLPKKRQTDIRFSYYVMKNWDDVKCRLSPKEYNWYHIYKLDVWSKKETVFNPARPTLKI